MNFNRQKYKSKAKIYVTFWQFAGFLLVVSIVMCLLWTLCGTRLSYRFSDSATKSSAFL